MPGHGGKRTSASSPKYSQKLPMAYTDAMRRTLYQPNAQPFTQFFKDPESYRLRDKPSLTSEEFPLGRPRYKTKFRQSSPQGYGDFK